MAQADDTTRGEHAFPWHLGVFDAHCHPTDTLANLQSIPGMQAKVLTVMATRAQDQELVAAAADEYGVTQHDADKDHKIVPAFGWHPWFSHQMFDETAYDNAPSLADQQKVQHYQSVLTPKSEDRDFLLSLPDPRPFGDFLSRTRQYLQRHPLALIGEVGLDRSFRIPEAWLPAQQDERDDSLTPGGREGRRLSPYRVSMDHQRKVLLAQLRLAGEMQRAVSCHGVAAHGIVYATVAETWKGNERKAPSKKERRKAAASHVPQEDEQDENSNNAGPKPYPPRICLHSYSGPAETVKQYIASSVPCEIFFSFSVTINAWSEDGNGKVEAAARQVPDDRILVESDLHTAGERLDHYLEAGVRKICKVKGWELEDGVRRLGRNWRRFVFGRE
ncbi:Metallo-dependent hydrolase [Teratosphaeria nubilosa]|uniref:Metallo-dependent hydrolase n=1 Tax=Teratosphaeria nubilosa TaxID=161662 RepID=A0A6G1LHX3_9PEZI|nr:Metallo-dependent hydrolase [Teratosphaeria nubilosa]